MDSTKSNEMQSSWWLGLFSGAIFVLLGWFLLTSPALSVLALVQILGFYWIIAGVIDIVSSLFGKAGGWSLVTGVLGIIAGMVVVNSPILASLLTTTFLIYIMGFMFIFGGITKFFSGGSGFVWRFIVGLVYIFLGMAMLGNMFFTAAFLVMTVGFLAVIAGVATIITSFTLKDGKK